VTDKPLEQRDYPIRAVGPCIYRRTASSPLAVLASRDLAADMADRLNATLLPPAPEATQWPARRTLSRDDWRDGGDHILRVPT
jgi:hypothetical protein